MATITVGVGKDYADIQSAIAALTANGDVIEIYSGTYTAGSGDAVADGTGTYDEVTLRAMAADVVIDCQDARDNGILAGADWVIEGFAPGSPLTIRNILGGGGGGGGAGIAGVYPSKTVTIRDVVIEDSANRGIHQLAAGSLVERCVVRDCDSYGILAPNADVRNTLVYRTGPYYCISAANVWNCTVIAPSGVSAAIKIPNSGSSQAKNNVVVAEAGATVAVGIDRGSLGVEQYNHFYGDITDTVSTGAAHASDVADPTVTMAALFSDADTDDFTLSVGSPLIDAGTDLSGAGVPASDDLSGQDRPVGLAWDVGAFEWVPEPEPDVPGPDQSTWWMGVDAPAPGTPDVWDPYPENPEPTLPYLVTASLYCDARADAADVGPGEDRRGWWGDTYVPGAGSLLWTLESRPVDDDTAAIAQQMAADALEWLIDDGLATDIRVTAEIHETGAGARLALLVVVIREDDGEPVPVLIPDLWGNYRG